MEKEIQEKRMNAEEELVDLLLDFIIVAAKLTKKVAHSMRDKKLKEGGNLNGQNERTGFRYQGSAECRVRN